MYCGHAQARLEHVTGEVEVLDRTMSESDSLTAHCTRLEAAIKTP